MNRKVAVLLVSFPLVCGIASVAGVYFVKPELFSHLPFSIGAKFAKSEVEIVAGKEPQDHVDVGALPDKDTSKQEPPEELQQTSTESVAITAAPDFVAPRSQTSPVNKAMREISKFQSRMARGVDASSRDLKSAMLGAQKIVTSNVAGPLQLDEIGSIAQYVLSGGDPSAAARALQNSKLTGQQKDLLEGVQSYATANLAVAKEKLLPLDAKRFGVMLDAHLTMVQVQLDEHSDFSKKLDRLAYVANLVPGTLIEEAAIRRMLPLFGRDENSKTFQYWTKRYLRRFQNSLYYEDFESSLVEALARVSEANRDFQSTLGEIFTNSKQAQAASLSRRLMTLAVDTGNTVLCDDIYKALLGAGDLETEAFADTKVLVGVCKAAGADIKLLEELRELDGLAVSEATKIRLKKAIAMAEAIHKSSPLQDDGHLGPYLPLSQSDDFASLFASVAQQIESSLSAIEKADGHETRLNN